MERVPQKEIVKKNFKLTTQVRSILERKNDKWSPVKAYNRLSKDVGIFHVLMKMFLSFFRRQEGGSDDSRCDGRVVKMFTEMVKKSLKDDDFVSGM